MTIADRVRAHPAFEAYRTARADFERASTDFAREQAAAAAYHLSKAICTELGLTETQRVRNLPQIAAQSKPRGRPRKAEPEPKRCPHCGGAL